jgi:hypothetical protein
MAEGEEPVTQEATMRTISADYNATTEAGYVRLTLPCSQKDILELGLGPGDWAWLSDTEIVMGAQLAIDDRYGLVGVPDWDTLVRLDEEGADDCDRVSAELNRLSTKEPPSMEDQRRILELLTQLEHFAPSQIPEGGQWVFDFRRALVLRRMGKLGLALLEAKEARRARPGDPDVVCAYLSLLGREDLPSAVVEAQTIAGSPDVPAIVLLECINILANQAELVSSDQLEPISQLVFDWCQRLDQTADLDQVEPSLLALSYFNRGLVHLRAARITQARRAFERAREIDPEGPMLDEAAQLQTYDQHAREVARKVRAIAEQKSAMSPVAA